MKEKGICLRSGEDGVVLFGLGVQVLLQRDAELVAQGLKLLEILVVLGLALDLGLDAC